MKNQYLKFIGILMGVLIGMLILPLSNSQANEEDLSFINSLGKYEVFLYYPSENEEVIKEMEAYINRLYEMKSENLIITKQPYNLNNCNMSILANLQFKEGVSFKKVLFIWTNSNMCEPIEIAMQNSSPSSKYKKGFSRLKVVTIPIDDEAKQSLELWKNGREDWYNFQYAENTGRAIEEIKEIFDMNKNEIIIGVGDDILRPSDIVVNKDNDIINVEENNQDEQIREVECSNEDIAVKFEIAGTRIVLSNGVLFEPNRVQVDEALENVYFDKELIHGATVYIQYNIEITKNIQEENVNISNISLNYDLNKSQYDEFCTLLDDQELINTNMGWERVSDNSKLMIQNIEFDDNLNIKTLKIVTSQVITAIDDLTYQNMIDSITYIKNIENEEGIQSQEGRIEFKLKSEKIQIIVQ